MRSRILVAGIACALIVAAPAVVFAAGFVSGAPAAGADPDPAHETPHAHARDRTSWPPAVGTIPSSGSGLVKVTTLVIDGVPDVAALAEKGVDILGSGTLEDPFVITGLNVLHELHLKDTDQYYVIRENFFAGELRLNWNGDKVHVHHNYIDDLRVNENNPRTGDATGGLIEKNKMGIVGQIRHFDGVFRENEVGPAPSHPFRDVMDDLGRLTPWFRDRIVLNIDGFDGALFEDNVIVGYVEMQLHGHHHASCFDCHSHNHGDKAKSAAHDHSIRYHEAAFRRNHVTVEEGAAFAYTDRGHAGDDRTARSEPDESLVGPHVHFTRISVEDNTFIGGPLVVDVFSADDRYHRNEKQGHAHDDGEKQLDEDHEYAGSFMILRNSVTFAAKDRTTGLRWVDAPMDAILVRGTKDVDFLIEGNNVELSNARSSSAVALVPVFGKHLGADAPAGVRLEGVRAANVAIVQNSIAGTQYGIAATEMDKATAWTVVGNVFRDVGEDIHYDESVQRAPTRG
ncbi:MAG TPA: hypothetical protein VM889_13755 [Candidatus Thermoplasmatota archaeon]|nr:hypothetical protein [Candidatus Thermoplasmatota archaeon]